MKKELTVVLSPKIEQHHPDPDMVREALEHVFASEVFINSGRMRTFLEYIVTETMEGRGDRIKAYSIALEVFGRKDDFAISDDSIVRTTANRLRNSLERYNASPDSRRSPLLISLPRGRYVPVFENNPACVPVGTNNERKQLSEGFVNFRQKYRLSLILSGLLLICLFAALVGLREWFPQVGRSTVTEATGAPMLLVQDTRFSPGSAVAKKLAHDLSALAANKLAAHGMARVVDVANDAQSLARDLAERNPSRVIYTLDTAIVGHGEEFALVWKLNDAHTREVSWADQVSLGSVNLNGSTADSAADALVSGVFGLDGAIPSLESMYQGELSCLSPQQRVAIIYDAGLIPNARECLENLVASHPRHAEAWASLARVYFRLARHAASVGEDPSDYGELLHVAAEKTYELLPQSFGAQLAVAFDVYNHGKVELFQEIARDMLKKFRDPHFKIIIGNAFWNIGRTAEGTTLVKEGREEMDRRGTLADLILAFDRYENEDFGEALNILDGIINPEFYRFYLLRAATLAKLGRTEAARAAIDKLHEKRPGYENNLYADFRHNNVADSRIEQLAEGLREAGLAVPVPAGNTR
ncbi:tetratricopeptide repeat protein [Agrobacterium sp. O3.4]|uniref:Tetratricopeptide repeat protein n=1 Tax=Agrobacterium cucumeris TaxID=2862866 RepID=A0ABY8RT22_9HYPH|nr:MULTISPECIES: tetratricopeptide repeat protein [Rhizobium/Agrobacterium group]MCZ7471013.1 hypothetical protein [Rhizobium rhizogenes]WHO10770.1 tetratricopeptide repeat protein [Agrobacterium cucumeris]